MLIKISRDGVNRLLKNSDSADRKDLFQEAKAMVPDISFEQYCAYITSLSKAEIKERLLRFDGPIKMDFTDEYLETLDVDRLRHILMAAVVTAQMKKIRF